MPLPPCFPSFSFLPSPGSASGQLFLRWEESLGEAGQGRYSLDVENFMLSLHVSELTHPLLMLLFS